MPEITAAIVRQKGGPFALETVHLAEPRDGEVLVRVVGVGMCHTDLVVRDQHIPLSLPALLGHEGSGVVERVGRGVTKVVPGDHVVMSFASCGVCANCLIGRGGYCSAFFGHNCGGGRLDGSTTCTDSHGDRVSACFFGQSSFADYALATERNVVKIPRDVPVELMGPLGCGIQTGAGAVINALDPEPGSSIAIFGAGAVGLAAVMGALVAGCGTIIAIDLNAERLALASELGATHVIDAGKGDPVAAIRALTGGEGVQYSLECIGLPKVVRQAVDALRVTGVCGVVGAAPLGTEFTLDMNGVMFGRTVRGIIEGDSIPDIFIPRLIELWRQGRFPFDRLVSFHPLGDIDAIAHAAERGDVIKAVLLPKPIAGRA